MLTEGPVILVDHGDNTASGGTQDVMSVVAEVMRQGLDDVLSGPICDPTAVARIVSAGTVASVTMDLGGRIDMPQLNLKGTPLTVTAKVARITDGEFTVTGPMADRRARADGPDRGPRRRLDADRGLGAARGTLRSRCVHTRGHRPAPQALRADQVAPALSVPASEPIVRHIVLCDGDGVTSSDLALFDLPPSVAARSILRAAVVEYACAFCGEGNEVFPDESGGRRRRSPKTARYAARPNLITLTFDDDGDVEIEVSQEYEA